MQEYNYNKEVKILLTQVLNAFGGLIINRINEQDSNVEDKIHVNLRYSPKSRIIHDIVNKNQHIELPIMAVSIGGISYDSTRTFNKITGFYLNSPETSGYNNYYQPLPINLSLNLSILTRYQNDLDQIITCLFNFFHPYIVISYKHPQIEQEVRCVVQWDGNISIQYPNDIAANLPYRITADSSFKVSGWIYRSSFNPAGTIYKIDNHFQAVSAVSDYYGMLSKRGEYNTDNFIISARPFVQRIDPYTGIEQIDSQSFMIFGNMFNYVNSLYVSSNSLIYPQASSFNLFADKPKLSANYPEFIGIPVTSFEIISDKIIKFTLPTPQTSGFITVIPVNEAGYGNLVIDSIRPTFNPYPSSMPEYFTYEEPQFEWVNGINIGPNLNP